MTLHFHWSLAAVPGFVTVIAVALWLLIALARRAP